MIGEWLYVGAVVLLNNVVLWVWKPWTQAYSGEKGKNLARKEDLDKILAEVRAVTATQKEIESRMSGELWDRQWRLNQKLEIYSRMLRAISDYIVWLADLSENAKFSTDSTTTTKLCRPITEEFYAAYSVAALFLSDESIAVVEKIKPQFFYHSSLDFNADQYGEMADKAHYHLTEGRRDLIASARKDLTV